MPMGQAEAYTHASIAPPVPMLLARRSRVCRAVLHAPERERGDPDRPARTRTRRPRDARRALRERQRRRHADGLPARSRDRRSGVARDRGEVAAALAVVAGEGLPRRRHGAQPRAWGHSRADEGVPGRAGTTAAPRSSWTTRTRGACSATCGTRSARCRRACIWAGLTSRRSRGRSRRRTSRSRHRVAGGNPKRERPRGKPAAVPILVEATISRHSRSW